MMALTPAEQALSDLIRQAHTSKNPVDGKSAERGVDLDGAYRLQAASQGKRVLKGYKLGLISPAKQQQMGIDTPIYGRIYADMLLQSTVNLADYVQPRMEPEIALVLTADIAPDSSSENISQAVGGFFVGVDVLDSVWRDYKFTAPEVVSDNTSGGGFLLAGRMSDHIDSGILRMYLNGELQTEGNTDALGNPVERLLWLAQCVRGLSAGIIVFLGSPAAAVPARAGTLEVVSPDGHALVARIVA